MKLWTDALDGNGIFDARYTCDLDNSSPELRWSEVPEGTAGFALTAEDLDAPTPPFFIWVVYEIPKTVAHLPVGIPPQDVLPNGIRQGQNDLRKLGYTGPCPGRRGETHRYVFRLHALRVLPELPARANGALLMTAIRDFIIETAEIQGSYGRSEQRIAG